MIRRYFISNIIIVLLLNLLVKPAWIFLIDRKVQITVGHDEYGLYGALLGLCLIFNTLLDMGITNYNNKILSADHTLIESKLPNMIAAKGLLSALYFLLVIAAAILLQYNYRAIYLVLLLAVVQTLNSFLLFLRSIISANHHFKTDSFFSVLDKVLMIVLCGILLFSPVYQSDFRIEWFIYTQIISYSAALLIALAFVYKNYSKFVFSHFSFSEMIQVCKKSIPYAILILLMAVYMRSDTLMLERMEGAEQNGIFLEAYRILDAANMIAFLFAGILLPVFSRMIAQKLNIESLVSTSANIMISASLALAAYCSVYSLDIMSLLYPDANATLARVFIFIISGFPAFCIMYIYSTLLTANGDINLLIKIAFTGGILSITLNAILIPKFHAIGASLTCFVVEWIIGFTLIILSIRKFNLSVSFIRILKFLLVLIVILLGNFLMRKAGVSPVLAIVPNIFLYILTVYVIKLWDKRNIVSYFKQFKNFQ